MRVALVERRAAPVYQQIAPEAKHLRELGMSMRGIAQALGVDDKTAAKAVHWPVA